MATSLQIKAFLTIQPPVCRLISQQKWRKHRKMQYKWSKNCYPFGSGIQIWNRKERQRLLITIQGWVLTTKYFHKGLKSIVIINNSISPTLNNKVSYLNNNLLYFNTTLINTLVKAVVCYSSYHGQNKMGIYKDTIYSVQGNKLLVGELITKTKITLFLGGGEEVRRMF